MPEPPERGGSGAQGPARIRLDVAYHGAGFRGFAENAGVRTVGGDLRAALERVLRQPVELTCAGRTDAGVHASGQVVSLDVVGGVPDETRLRSAVNALVGPEVVVRSVRQVPPTFDARFSARWRRYRYLILNAEFPDPFLAATTWWIKDDLDLDAMNDAALALVGEHDFSSFCRRPDQDPAPSLVRLVHRATWARCEGGAVGATPLVSFEIVASAFCHQMVRSIVGALVAVGRSRMGVERFAELLRARDRTGAPNLAPPRGLALVEVGYEQWAPG